MNSTSDDNAVENSVEKTVESTVNRLASGAHEAVDRVAGATNQAAETLCAKRAKIKATEEQWLEDVRTYVQANPITALSMAVAGGYLLSRILKK